MAELERFGVSMDSDLLSRFDSLLGGKNYASRSEAIRDLVRRELVTEEWTDPESDVIGTITIVYEHNEHELASALADLQHRHHSQVLCSTHVHLDEHNCLEVIIVRGTSRTVRSISDSLIATKGVKHGGLVCSTTGK